MRLFMVKVLDVKEQCSNWFFVAARDERELREMCEDAESQIIEIVTEAADMAQELDKEFDGIVICNNA